MRFDSFAMMCISLLLAFLFVTAGISLMHLLWQALFWLAIIGLAAVIYFMFSVWMRMKGHDVD